MKDRVERYAAQSRAQDRPVAADRARCLRTCEGKSSLFFVHDIRDDYDFSLIVSQIDPDIAVYSLHGLSSDWLSFETVEGVASSFVEIIRTVQPNGPYCVVGYSSLGLIAYEVVVQLLGADEHIAFFGVVQSRSMMLETGDERNENNRWQVDEIQHGNSISRLEHSEDQSLTSSVLSANLILPDSLSDATMRQYSPQHIPIPVNLFTTADLMRDNRVVVWNEILPEVRINVIALPDEHQLLTKGLHVHNFGKELSHRLRNALKISIETPEALYDPLIALQVGKDNLSPFILVPGAGATAASFVHLLSYFDKSVSIIGCEPRGLDGVLVPHATVEAAAEAYIAAIRKKYMFREVHLFGHSFGGWVAYQMAQRLLQAKITVGSITILDSNPPGDICEAKREHNFTDVTMEFIEAFELALERALEVKREDIESLNESAQRRLLHRCLVREGVLPRRSEPDVLLGPLRTFGMAVRTQYIPDNSYPDRLNLILVDDPRLDEIANRHRQEKLVSAWRQWAPNLVYSHLPGNHMTILKEPWVQALGNAF
jgi:thioesterase domain-containing protein